MTPIDILCASETEILNSVKLAIKERDYNYKTFGTEIEDVLENVLVKIYTKKGIIKSDSDYTRAQNKNEFPDFRLNTKPNLAIEFKSGNRSKLENGVWVNCNNSNNDMGTINKWRSKLAKYGGDNIYYIFIEYNFNDKVKEVQRVKIAPFYKFLGINSGGVLKYREKDGNLRPTDFDSSSEINSAVQFEKLLEKTELYRAKRIILKHFKNLPEDEATALLKELENLNL